MGRLAIRAGVALLLCALFALPASGTTLPDYAVTKLDSHFTTLNTLQSLVDLVMGRDSTNGTGNASTTRWSFLMGNSYNLSRILVSSTLSGGGGADSYSSIFQAMADPAQCRNCARNVSSGLAAVGNNSSFIYGDSAGDTGRARLWKEWGGYLGATDAANASRNVSRLAQFQSSLIRDAITLYTENLKQTYAILGI